MRKLEELLKEWTDGANTMSDAEDLIHELQVELSGKESVIEVLQEKETRIKYLSDKLDLYGIPFGHPTEGDR